MADRFLKPPTGMARSLIRTNRPVGGPVLHKFAICGHTVEKDHRKPPPKHTMASAAMPSDGSDLVLWNLRCMDCDWIHTVEKRVCEYIKTAIELLEKMRLQRGPSDKFRVEVQRVDGNKRSKIITTIWIHDTSLGEGGSWTFYSCVAVPARIVDSHQSYNWQAYLSLVDGNEKKRALRDKVRSIQFCIDDIVASFEARWNEPVLRDPQPDVPRPNSATDTLPTLKFVGNEIIDRDPNSSDHNDLFETLDQFSEKPPPDSSGWLDNTAL